MLPALFRQSLGSEDDFSSQISKYSPLANISITGLSTAISGQPVVESLRRRGLEIFGYAQSRQGPGMNGHNTERVPAPFGYEFAEEFSQHPPPDLPPNNQPSLLNMQEESFLTNFYVQQQGLPTSSDFNQLDQLAQEEHMWMLDQAPPTVHDITTATIPSHTSSHISQQLSPQIDMGNLPAHPQNHENGLAVGNPISQHPTNPRATMPAYTMQQSQASQSHHLFSPDHTPQHQLHTPTTLEGIHTPQAMVAISNASGIQKMQAEAQNAILSSAIVPRIDTSVGGLSTFGPFTAPVSNGHDDITNPRLYQFGSDQAFDPYGFRPTFPSENHEKRAHYLTEELTRMKAINRGPETQNPIQDHMPKKRTAGSLDHQQDRKRRRSIKREEDDSQPSDSDNKLARRESEASVSQKRQRRASAPGARPVKRENLSEQQKRQNHIASEQKRRQQIKSGFDELNQLVPGLRDNGQSKSAMLMEACAFLEQVQKANEKIAAMMGSL
ncbi:hypothetical protein BT63DRAFT_331081 [Microthyrium microscopicum]|uniref:BHLH domain-containing protein n=1 Tax=Microthyrium microscopicum TaxID=703497 RepID=A0A6A6U4G0_9PEZI|nr:hypothetical protein BT63DRAFT_331081 [Microthyrium microscopicum]